MPIWRTITRALLLRCPRCGERGIVAGWGRFVESCPRCRHLFEREEGYWLGAVLINTVAVVLLFGVVFVSMLVITWPDVPWTAVTITTVTVNLAAAILFYPWSKTLWVALDLMIHPPPE